MIYIAFCFHFIFIICAMQNNLKMGVAVQNLNEDTLGSHLKAGIAQFVALEFTRAAGRDNRMLNRYLPWLYHPPSAMQQGWDVAVHCRCCYARAVRFPRDSHRQTLYTVYIKLSTDTLNVHKSY